MRKLNALLVIAILSFTVPFQIAAHDRIIPSEAGKYVGKRAMVCGQVEGAE